MHHAHKAGSHAAQVGGDHHLFAVFFAHHILRKKDLLAEINGFFSKGIHHHVAVRASNALKAVHVGVDARVKILVTGHASREIGIHQHLVEHSEIAVHAKFDVLFFIADDARARRFGASARQRGNGDFVGRGILYQFPALVVFGFAGIVEQVADALAGIKHTAAAKRNQGAGFSTLQKGLHLIGVAVHAVRGGFAGGVDIKHHIAAFHGQFVRQIFAFKKTVQKKDGGTSHCLAAHGQKIAKLAQAALANHIITDIFCITEHSCPHSMA